MALVKSQGSSCCKGKEIASNLLDVPDVGKEVEYFELEHSIGEETQCDPNSECSPLIDP